MFISKIKSFKFDEFDDVNYNNVYDTFKSNDEYYKKVY